MLRGTTDNNPITVRPIVRVGNIGPGKGTVVISPDKVYETYDDPDDDLRKFVIKFTALGPMWNSEVDIVIPAELDAISEGELTDEDVYGPSGSLTPTINSGSLSIGNVRGGEVTLDLAPETGIGADGDVATVGVEDGDGDAADHHRRPPDYKD